MKKIWTLLASVLLVACIGGNDDPNDITDKFDGTRNIHESFERHSDGSISYHAIPWGGLEASVRDRNLPVDWSGYESITIEFAEPLKHSVQVKLSNKMRTFGRVGITKLRYYFDGQDATQVDYVAIQSSDSCTLEIKRVYLTPGTSAWETTKLWEGECSFGNWENGISIPASQFLEVQDGDQLEFIYQNDTSDPKVEYWQFKTIYGGTTTTLEGNADQLNEWGCASVGNSGVFRIHLTAKDVKELRKIGLFVNGFYNIVTQVNLLKRGVSTEADTEVK